MTENLLRQLLSAAERIAVGIESLRVDMAEGRTAADVRLGLLLRAVRAALGSASFTAAELVELVAAKLSTRIALQAAISAIAGETRHPSKSLGHFLRNNAGRSADGLRLVKIKAGLFRIESAESRGREHWPS